MRQILHQSRPIRRKATGDIAMVKSKPSSLPKTRHWHFIGAGGIGMSGLAKVLLDRSDLVTGSDAQGSEIVRNLNDRGAKILIGHGDGNLPEGAGAVVISAAIKEDNPELREARGRNLPVLKYAQMLGALMDQFQGIAVCGTHGKSTTSGWLSFLMSRAGLEPNFIVGAEVTQLGDSSGSGKGDFLIAEACEYDRSFLNLSPQIALMLNIEQDHLDYYRDEDDIVDAFLCFASKIRPGGKLIANGDDSNVRKVLSRLPGSVESLTFGLDPSSDFYAQNVSVTDGLHEFDVYNGQEFLGRVRNPLPGRHNVLNALAVVATATVVGVPARQTVSILGEFIGIDRRMMLKDIIDNITIMDDYAHHPTEIRACLEAIRERFDPRRLWCIFQPHQYSRTRFLLEDFATSFQLADITIIPEIYFVRDTEQSKKTVNAEILARRINEQDSKALCINEFSHIITHLIQNVEPGDLVITMGAGDIWKVADGYIQWLREHHQNL